MVNGVVPAKESLMVKPVDKAQGIERILWLEWEVINVYVPCLGFRRSYK